MKAKEFEMLNDKELMKVNGGGRIWDKIKGIWKYITDDGSRNSSGNTVMGIRG